METESFSAQTFLFSFVSFLDWSPWLTLLLINRFLLTGVLPIFSDIRLSGVIAGLRYIDFLTFMTVSNMTLASTD